MNTYFALCLLAFVAVASANPIGHVVPVATIETISHPSYTFNYAVNDPHTGDNKAQWETRDGDVVRGAYSLVEPDGNVRLVEYTADDLHGFNALVRRTGPNLHSVGLPVAAPVVAPVVEHAPVAPVIAAAPIVEQAAIVEHAPVIAHAPVIEQAPVIAPVWNVPILPSSPLVHISGSSHGPHGHVSRWAAGPISLDGNSLTIRSHH